LDKFAKRKPWAKQLTVSKWTERLLECEEENDGFLVIVAGPRKSPARGLRKYFIAEILSIIILSLGESKITRKPTNDQYTIQPRQIGLAV
jgi:hypothetical protein